MKMQTQPVEINDARKAFGWTSAQEHTSIRVVNMDDMIEKYIQNESNEYFICRVGRQQPNMVILLDEAALPVQDGAIIDPFRGFEMPEVTKLMSLEDCGMSDIRICFFQHLPTAEESQPMTFLRLVDPENADCILVTGQVRCKHKLCDVVDWKEELHTNTPMFGRSRYARFSFLEACQFTLYLSRSRHDDFYISITNGGDNRITECHYDYMYYKLFPLSSFYSGCQDALAARKAKMRIVRCANKYLGIPNR